MALPIVAAVGRRRDAEHPGGAEMIEDLLIALAESVVSFVDDDGIKITGVKLRQPLVAHQRLHRADDDPVPLSEAGALSLFDGANKTGRFEDLVRCLFEQLAAVREDEHSAAHPHTVLRHLGEYDRFSAAGRQDEERLAVSGSPLLKDPVLCLLLIRAQLHQKLPGFQPLAAGADGC